MVVTQENLVSKNQAGASLCHLTAEATLSHLKTDREQGLTELEVEQRRVRYGRNVLADMGPSPVPRLLFHQFGDLLIILLIVAAGFAYYLEDIRGGSILLAIVLVNAAIGAYQEYKAEKVLELLRRLIRTKATVIRGGTRKEVEESELVPGDIVFLDEGNAVPANMRLLETTAFSTNDFNLTGESLPQEKRADLVVPEGTALTDQDNVAFLGTSVARGNALGVVVATGMTTAIGDIARLGQTIQRDVSPLQQEVNSLARTLTTLAGFIALALFAMNLFLRRDEFSSFELLLNSSLLFAIGVAAACVPQGLPAQISVALSLGVGRLARNQAVVKRLSAVETLGSTTVICSDKTGTITRNEMTIVRCWVNGRDLEVSGEGYDPAGEILEYGRALSTEELERAKQFFEDGFLASHGRTHAPDAEHGAWYAIGDPTEAAFMPLAIKTGLAPEDLEKRFPLLHELPFDSTRKRMTMVRRHKGRIIGYMKGATPSVLGVCDRIHRDGTELPLTDAERNGVLAKAAALSAESLRVIALAYRDFPASQSEFSHMDAEREFVFAGLVAMIDPPRRGVEDAIHTVRNAHVRLFMITGDDAATARAIGKRIGMEEGRVLISDGIGALSDTELTSILRDRSLIFSRVSPADKYRIVKLLKQMGEVVAVTGDGVNDTLSLRQADIGVAMGKVGSDVAKEAAEIVLIDDNFGTLVVAIREGRTIFQNLKHVILSSITANLGELTVVLFGFAGLAFGLPIPITAVQILAIDLIAELLPLMALTLDTPEGALMAQPPRKLGEHILNRRSLVDLCCFGALMGAASYLSFYMVFRSSGSLGVSQAAAYTTIALVQYVNILSRRTSQSVFTGYLLANKSLLSALVVSLLVVLTIINVPTIGMWLGFEPMRAADWTWPIVGAAVFLFAFEIRKLSLVVLVRSRVGEIE
jgi:Ca2+-transporting ATPase